MLIVVPHGVVTLPTDFNPQKLWRDFIEKGSRGLRFATDPMRYSAETDLRAGTQYHFGVAVSVAPPGVPIDAAEFEDVSKKNQCPRVGAIGLALVWMQDARVFEERAQYHALAFEGTYYIASLGVEGTFLGRNREGISAAKFASRLVMFSEREFSL